MSKHLVIASLICGLIAPMALAQPAGEGGGGGAAAGQPGGAIVITPGPGGAAAGSVVLFGAGGVGGRKQEILDAIKEKLEVSNEEWEKLAPKIEKVMDTKRAMSTGAGIFRSSQNGAAVIRTADGTPTTAPSQAMQEVRAAVEDKEISDEEIAKRLAAMREARNKAKAEYEAAQKELREALTPRQEALLAMMGQID